MSYLVRVRNPWPPLPRSVRPWTLAPEGALGQEPPPCRPVPCTAVPCLPPKPTVSAWTLVAIAAAGLALNVIKLARPGKWGLAK